MPPAIRKGDNDMNIPAWVFLLCFFCIFPLTACLLFDRYKRHFHGFRMLIPILLYTILSWGTVNGFVLLKYLLNPESFRGPEGAFALFFGGIYLWVTSTPVFLLYPAVRRMKKERSGE